MADCFHHSHRAVVLATLLTSILTSVTCESRISNCLALPEHPRHGKIKYTGGHIKIRLTCPNKEREDLPEDAPGRGGILTCGPLDEVSDDQLDQVKPYKCLPYKWLRMLYMQVRVLLTTDELCLEGPSISVTVNDVLRRRVQSYNSHAKYTCHVGASGNECTENKDFPDEKKHLITVTTKIWLDEGYTPMMSVSDYNRLNSEIKSKLLTNLQLNELKTVTLWSTEIGPWMGWCHTHAKSMGTDLEATGLASCRGCHRNYILDEEAKNCYRCPASYFTKTAFATECLPCENAEDWMSQETYEKDCGGD